MKKKGIILGIIIAIVASIGIIVFVASDREKTTNTIKIGISTYNQYDTFVASLMEQVKKRADLKEELTGVEFIIDIYSANGIQSEQNDQIEKFIDNNYDVICVNLVDRTDPSVILNKAQAAGIPVIFFNRELVPEDLKRYQKAYYVGAITNEPGVIQGDLITDYYENNAGKLDRNQDEKIQYIMLEGEAGHQDAILRTEYSVNTIVENGIAVEKLSYAIANWNRDQAKSKMDKLIEQYGDDIEVVIANNDDMALGAIDAYLSRKISREEMPIIVGIDGTKQGLEAVKNGTMYGTAYNDVISQGNAILELAYSLVTNKQLPEKYKLQDEHYIRFSYSMITKENVNEFMRIMK